MSSWFFAIVEEGVFKDLFIRGAIEDDLFYEKITGNYQVLDWDFNGKGPCSPFPFYRLLKISLIFVERIYLTGLIICSLSELKWR